MPEELSTALEVRYEVQIGVGLEAKLQADEEWRIEGSLQDFALSDGMGNLLLGHDLLLGEDFHRVNPLGVLLPHLEDLAERSATNELQELEVSRG